MMMMMMTTTTKINLLYIQRFICYFIDNRVFFKQNYQSMNTVLGKDRCLFTNLTESINTLCGQNVEFVSVKPGGTYSNHWALKGYQTHG
jgi:hypothetical protein